MVNIHHLVNISTVLMRYNSLMPGNQVKNWDLYHKLIAEGKTKEEAARIANSSVSKGFGFAGQAARKRKLMRSLKSRRRYPPPIRGGAGKRRSKLSSMNKAERIAKAKSILVDPPTTITSSVSIVKSDPAENQVFGWASVAITPDGQYADMEGHMVDTSVLEKAAYNSLVALASGDAANDTHNSAPFGRLIESMVYTPEKISALGLPDTFPQGWWVGLELPPDRYQSVVSGDRLMFSIEGHANLEPVS